MAYKGNPVWPARFQTGTVVGRYVDSNGVALAGKTVTFQPRPPVLRAVNDETTVVSVPTVVTLADDGSFRVELPATDDPDVSPRRWTYLVTENWDGGQSFDISVLSGVLSNLLDISPVQDSTGIMRYVGPPGPPGPAFGQAAPSPAPLGAVPVLQADGTVRWLVPVGQDGGIADGGSPASVADTIYDGGTP